MTDGLISGLILGAYALEPTRDVLDGREEAWYELLAGIEGGAGLEVPYREGLHPDGPERLAELLPKDWSLVITMLPSTMAGIRGSSVYGLASEDADGRAAAVDALAPVREEIRRLNDATGVATVRAVHIHSGPRGGGSATAFGDSLLELAGEDWSGAALVVEHCDAWRADGAVEKGFLALEDELAAVTRAGAGIGQSINWGRSVIEGRSADRGAEHIAQLVEAGTLAGTFFSGASATGGALGGPWKDVHNPLDTVDPSSLLGAAEIARAVAAFGGTAPGIIGVKVTDPAAADDFSAHLDPLRVTAAAVRNALA